MKNRKISNEEINNIIIGILSLVLFLAPLLIYPRVLVYDYNIPKVILLYTCGLFLLVILFIKNKEIKYDKKDLLMLVFFILAEVSFIFSINKKTSLLGEEGRHEGILMLMTYMLVYYFSKYYFKQYKNLYRILFGVVIVICILSILQFYDIVPFQKTLGLQYRKYWTSGTLGNPNFLGNYITLFLPIFMSLFILNGKKRYLVLSNIIFLAMLCSLTRSAWVAFAVYSLIGIIYIIYKKEKVLIKNAILLVTCFVIVFGLGNILSNGRIIGRNKVMFDEFKNAASEGISGDMGSGRIEIWKVTLNEIKMHPWIGTGIDTLKDAIITDQFDYYIDRAVKTGTHVDKAHNEYLQIAATMGIPALVVYLVFIFLIIKNNMKNIFKDKITLILSLSIIGYLVQAFFNISTIGVAPVFWMILGLIQNEEFKKEADTKIE